MSRPTLDSSSDLPEGIIDLTGEKTKRSTSVAQRDSLLSAQSVMSDHVKDIGVALARQNAKYDKIIGFLKPISEFFASKLSKPTEK